MEKLTKDNKNSVHVGTILTDGKDFKLQVTSEHEVGRSKMITVKIISDGRYIYFQGISHYYGMYIETEEG